MSALLPGAHLNFLQRAEVQSVAILQVKRNARGLSGRSDFCFERDGFCWIDSGEGYVSQASNHVRRKSARSVFRGNKTPKDPESPTLPLSQKSGSKRAQHNARLRDAMKFAAGASWKPFRLKIAAFSGPQLAKRGIDLGFQIIREPSPPEPMEGSPSHSISLRARSSKK